MANLPSDIITLILIRLPVKSLIRFKCVSKYWNSLITNPHLISLHLTQSLSSNNRLLILNYGTHLQTTPFPLSSEGGVVSSRRFDFEGCFHGYEVSVCGCCNGLVALVLKKEENDGGFEKVVLWNPSLGCWFVVPCAPEIDDGSLVKDFLGLSFGFGFDGVDNDYKIVRIVDYFHPNHVDGGGGEGNGDDGVDGNGATNEDVDGDGDDAKNEEEEEEENNEDGSEGGEEEENDEGGSEEGGNHRCRFGFIFREVMVYSLRANCWNMIYVSFFGDKMEWFCPGAVINNHLVHWLFWSYRNKRPILRGFDLLSYKWTKLALPDFKGNADCLSDDNDDDDDDDTDYGYQPEDFVVLGVLDECLCLVTRICPEFDNVYVWVMKEYGVKESWTKVFGVTEASIVGPLLSTPLGIVGDEVLLRRESEDGCLSCYDVKGKIVKAAPKVTSCGLKLRDAKLCVESLVPVGRMIDGSGRRLDEVNG